MRHDKVHHLADTTPSDRPGPVFEAASAVLGCKWALAVLELVRRGVTRPGAMQRALPGLSAKVLNERLRKLCRYGILERRVGDGMPPRVDYVFTDFGRAFAELIGQLAELERRFSPPPSRREARDD